MQDLASLDAHRRSIQSLVPLLEAIRSVAEIGWRRAEQARTPLGNYTDRLIAMMKAVSAVIDPAEHWFLRGSGTTDGPMALLLVTAERGLCGRFNHHLVNTGLQHAERLREQGHRVELLCLGTRGQRLLEEAGESVLFFRPMPSLGVPDYIDVEEMALEMLDLVEQGQFIGLNVVFNQPVRQFNYDAIFESLMPPQIGSDEIRPSQVTIKPSDDGINLLSHLLAEYMLVGLYRVIMESVASEQLARIHTMRLAVDNANDLLEDLTAEYRQAQHQATTNALIETLAGFRATMRGNERR